MAQEMTPAEERAELRAVIREAHETIKDMERLLAKMEKVKVEIEDAVVRAFDEQISEAVQSGLAGYRDAITGAIDTATESVFERFNKLSATLLGETVRARKKGLPDVPQLIRSLSDEVTGGL